MVRGAVRGQPRPVDIFAVKAGLVHLIQCKAKPRLDGHTTLSLINITEQYEHLIPVYATQRKGRLKLTNRRTGQGVKL